MSIKVAMPDRWTNRRITTPHGRAAPNFVSDRLKHSTIESDVYDCCDWWPARRISVSLALSAAGSAAAQVDRINHIGQVRQPTSPHRHLALSRLCTRTAHWRRRATDPGLAWLVSRRSVPRLLRLRGRRSARFISVCGECARDWEWWRCGIV